DASASRPAPIGLGYHPAGIIVPTVGIGHLAIGGAARTVEQDIVPGVAEPPAQRAEPVDLGRIGEAIVVQANPGFGVFDLDAGPSEIGFHTGDPIRGELVAVADLSAAKGAERPVAG